jgi:hypothetical protein
MDEIEKAVITRFIKQDGSRGDFSAEIFFDQIEQSHEGDIKYIRCYFANSTDSLAMKVVQQGVNLVGKVIETAEASIKPLGDSYARAPVSVEELFAFQRSYLDYREQMRLQGFVKAREP